MPQQAQQRWRQSGAWLGGTVPNVALAPDTQRPLILAATRAGLFRSNDDGASWHPANQGLTEPGVLALAFGPASVETPAIVYASTDQARLYRSYDGALQWQEVTAWAGLGVISALALSPNYAVDRSLFAATSRGVFRSFDDGKSWESADFGLLDAEALCIACAPSFAAAETMWVGTALGGLFRSRNAARAWRESGQGLPDAAIQCLATSATTRDRIYAGTEIDGVYASEDGGITWHRIGDDLAGESVNALVVLANTDGQEMLVAGAGSGLYRSEDGGMHWAPTLGGDFLALSLAARADGLIVAGAYEDGVFISTDAGQSWRPANHGLTGHAPPIVARTASRTLFAVDLDGRLEWTQDGGATWQADGVPDEPVRAMILVEREATPMLFAATTTDLHCRSASDGHPSDWSVLALPSGEISFLAASPRFAQDRILVCGDSAGQLYLSEQAGESWSPVTTPWTGEHLLHAIVSIGGNNQPIVYALAIAANAQGHYQVHAWLSADLGAHWEFLAGLESESPAVLMAAPDDPASQTLFLATRHRIIKLFSDAAGGELRVTQHFMAEGTRITGITAQHDYASSRTIFVTTNTGIHRSTDGGASWEQFGSGLDDRTVVALLLGPHGDEANDACAVTLGGGIWSLGEQ